MVIEIPHAVTNSNLPGLLRRLASVANESAIDLDIGSVRFLVPAAIVAILSHASRWMSEGKTVRILRFREASNFQYLQRIDFFARLGIGLDEAFTRRPEAGRFVPIKELTRTTGDVGLIAAELSRCVFPEGSSFDDHHALFQYASGELLANGKYHSQGRVFVCAQYFSQRNLAMLAIADDGIGISGSFRGTSREHEATNGEAALSLALEPGVSSPLLRPPSGPYERPNNRGIGLTMSRILTRESAGRFQVATGDGWLDEDSGRGPGVIQSRGFEYPGTLVSVSINRDQVGSYQTMRSAALREIGMDGVDGDVMFI